MTPDEIRAVLAPMYKGHTATFKTPDTIIDVHFDGEVFNICSKDYSGSAAGVSNTKSLKDAVTRVAYFFVPKVGQIYQHDKGSIYSIIAIANEFSTRSDYPPSVVYKDSMAVVWTKPLDKFLRKMKRIK